MRDEGMRSVVIPSERSESRDLHLRFLTESTENTEDCRLGERPAQAHPPYPSASSNALMVRQRSLSREVFSAISTLSVRQPAKEGAIRPSRI
jgi:hypothetical protein